MEHDDDRSSEVASDTGSMEVTDDNYEQFLTPEEIVDSRMNIMHDINDIMSEQWAPFADEIYELWDSVTNRTFTPTDASRYVLLDRLALQLHARHRAAVQPHYDAVRAALRDHPNPAFRTIWSTRARAQYRPRWLEAYMQERNNTEFTFLRTQAPRGYISGGGT